MKKALFFFYFFYIVFQINSTTIKITNGEWAPYLSPNLKNYGSISKLVSDSFASQGITVHYEFFPWKRAIELAKTKEWNGTIGWTKTKDRENSFYFSKEALFAGKIVFFSLKNTKFNWNKIEDLKKYKIGITIGYSYGDIFDSNVSSNSLNTEATVEDLNNFKKLINGRIDIFPIDLEVGLNLLNLYFTESEKKLISYHEKLLDERFYYLLLNKTPENKYLMEKFDKGFQSLKKQ